VRGDLLETGSSDIPRLHTGSKSRPRRALYEVGEAHGLKDHLADFYLAEFHLLYH